MEQTIVKSGYVEPEFSANYFGIEWISTEQLVIDANYQRPPIFGLIKVIAENWDWQAVRTLAVSMRSDGEYAVMDGQQRLMAARQHDITKLPCQVYIDLTERQEAELFLKLNNSKKPSANDLFRAKIAEDDPEAKLIVLALNKTGWELDLDATKHTKNSKSWGTSTVNSATALLYTYRQGGIQHLQSVLNVCHGWYGQHMAASADILIGISIFLLKHKQIDMSRLTEKLSEETPSGIIGKSIQLQAAELAAYSGASTRSKMVSRVILGIYNKGMKANNRLPE